MIKMLFTITLLELFLGGGGRLFEIGPGTLRMLLFAPCLLIGLFALLAQKRITDGQMLAAGLAAAYLLIHLPGLVNGTLHGADPTDMLTELQQSLYWLAAPFFALVLQSEAMVRRSAALVEFAGVALAGLYLAILIGAALGYIDFAALYAALNNSGEFVGRGEHLFFYKGFLYLGIATVFLVALPGRHRVLLLGVVGTALVMTLTRGFLLATAGAVLVMLMLQGRSRAVGFGLALAVVAVLVVWIYLPSDAIVESRSISNSQRIDDAVYVADHLSAGTFLFGEGFGSLINDRPVIENTFMWVFWDLGITGLVFWLAPLALCTRYFLAITRNSTDYRLACGFYFGVVVVYIETLSNPFLNNPIGLSFVMIALFSLRTIAAGCGGTVDGDRRVASGRKLPFGATTQPTV
jgi:hypothetical protein